jgi:hypothetical protein
MVMRAAPFDAVQHHPQRERSVPSRYLNIQEAADHLHVSVRWLRDHRDEIPYRRFGGLLRYTVEDLDKYADAQRYSVA